MANTQKLATQKPPFQQAAAAPIVVLGSLNMDFVVRVDELPVGGQTVMGRDFQTLPGGKGANQACAAGKLGGRTTMVGRVGDDVFAQRLLDSLAGAGVDVSLVQRTPGCSTGAATISVDSAGQNQIIVAAGANGRVGPGDVAAAFERLPRDGFLLLQLETPLETVAAAARAAASHGLRVVLDPAPAQQLDPSLLGLVDILTPNETEAHRLLGQPRDHVSPEEVAEVASALLELGPRAVILKLGERGAWLQQRGRGQAFPAPRVHACDSTAAGDTFNAALAVALAEGAEIDLAIRFANAAAASSVTKPGAQTSAPTRAEVAQLLQGQPAHAGHQAVIAFCQSAG
ncbi:ribokinase [Botrimarina sp.]|uniref:ribokinase n=1 Tax=Botrimarina sp. TaxID=2795802 RepID=UPI0032EC65E2